MNTRPTIKIFISYAHADDDAFDFAGPLKRLLKAVIRAKTDLECEVFLDRESISLGSNWHEDIQRGVQGSLCFLACFSGTYARSQACREEFILFQETSKANGVEGLLIPLVLAGFDSLPPEGEDIIADYTRNHQAIDLQSAWVEGPESPAFKRTALQLADRVITAYRDSEDRLLREESDGATSRPTEPSRDATTDQREQPEEDEDEAGILDLMGDLEDEIEEATPHIEEFVAALNDMTARVEGFPADKTPSSPKEARLHLMRLASEIKDPGRRLESSGKAVRERMAAADQILRELASQGRENPDADLKEKMQEGLEETVASLGSMKEAREGMAGFLESLAGPMTLSSALRKSLAPARRGTTAIQDAISIIELWASPEGGLIQ